MCHELWMWRERRRSERFDEELRYLLDEEPERAEPPTPVVKQEREAELDEPERLAEARR
jgi:hypothetical protein